MKIEAFCPFRNGAADCSARNTKLCLEDRTKQLSRKTDVTVTILCSFARPAGVACYST